MKTIAQIEKELEEAEQQARIQEQHTGQTDSAHHERAAALREKLKAAKKITRSPEGSSESAIRETKKEKES